MFKVNDYIMYGMTGGCQVVDITKESFIDNLQKEYYVLKYIYSNDTIIKISTDNKKVPMRKILSKGEVTTLINSMPNSETIWIDDDRKRRNRNLLREQYNRMASIKKWCEKVCRATTLS